MEKLQSAPVSSAPAGAAYALTRYGAQDGAAREAPSDGVGGTGPAGRKGKSE